MQPDLQNIIADLGNSSFPETAGESGAAPICQLAINDQRYFCDTPRCCESAPWEEHLGVPVRICVLQDGPVIVLAIATDDSRIHLSLIDGNILNPIWLSRPASLILCLVESLLIVDTRGATSARLEVNNGKLFYFHNRGIAIVSVGWMHELSGCFDSAPNFPVRVAKQPSVCHHLILASDMVSTVVGAALLRDVVLGSETMLCI